MESLTSVTISFTLILALALIIERALELLKTLSDMLDSRFNWYIFWTKRAYRLRNCLEKRVYVLEYAKPKARAAILYLFRDVLLNGNGRHSGTIPIISGDMVRVISVRTICKLIGTCFGIMLALWLNIDLGVLWHEAAGKVAPYQGAFYEDLRKVISGIIIGLGSGPVHKIIIIMERRQQQKHPKESQHA